MTQTRKMITVKNKPALYFGFFKDYFSTQVRSPIHCAAVQTVVSAQGAWIADAYPCAQSQHLHPQFTSFHGCCRTGSLTKLNTEGTWLPLLATVEGLFNETKWGHTDVYPTAKAWLPSSLELLLVQSYMSFLQFACWNKHKNMTNQVTNANEQLWAKFWNKTLSEIA